MNGVTVHNLGLHPTRAVYTFQTEINQMLLQNRASSPHILRAALQQQFNEALDQLLGVPPAPPPLPFGGPVMGGLPGSGYDLLLQQQQAQMVFQQQQALLQQQRLAAMLADAPPPEPPAESPAPKNPVKAALEKARVS